MITDQDVAKIKAAFKEYFVTKDDLKNFATKDDLKAFATKEDLDKFAPKWDVERQFASFAKEVAQMFADFTNLMEKRFEQMDRRFDKLEKKFDESDMKFKRRFELHEDRIASLEVSTFKPSTQG